MKQKELNIFKADMALISADEKFIIIAEDHNSKKGKEFFRQSESAWNDAVEEVARAGYKIVLPSYHLRPYVRYMSGKPPVKNVVEVDYKIYSVETLVHMKWVDIIGAILEEVNKNREKYNVEYAEQFFLVECANMTISNGPKFKFRESLERPKTFMRINENEFEWMSPKRSGNDNSNMIAIGNGKLEQYSGIYYLRGACYWSMREYQRQSAKLLAQLIPAKIQPIPPLNEETMWQEIIFNPVPLVNEPVIGNNGEINQSVIKKEHEKELACYASHM